jgi:hypothetical protein
VVLRPDRTTIRKSQPSGAPFAARGTVVQARYLGAGVDYLIRVGDHDMRAVVDIDNETHAVAGDTVHVVSQTPLYFAEDGLAITAAY